jgi:hypothetical protein
MQFGGAPHTPGLSPLTPHNHIHPEKVLTEQHLSDTRSFGRRMAGETGPLECLNGISLSNFAQSLSKNDFKDLSPLM